jgi:hypothetical protein
LVMICDNIADKYDTEFVRAKKTEQ